MFPQVQCPGLIPILRYLRFLLFKRIVPVWSQAQSVRC